MPLIHIGDEGRIWFTADNVMGEDFTHPAQVTNHPIGNRSTPADFRLREPITIDLVLRVTESPLVPAAGGPNPLVAPEGGLSLAPAAADLNPTTRPRAAGFKAELKRYEAGLWEYLSESMGLYTPLVMVNWSYSIRTPVHVDFNITLQEIEFIQSQRVELPPLVVLKKAPEVCPVVDKGDKAKQSLGSGGSGGSGVSPRDQSFLSRGVQGNLSDDELVNKLTAGFGFF